jgi:hypothetical protein
MSEAMDRGVDELINESMRRFAEQSGFWSHSEDEIALPMVEPPPPPPLPAARMTSHFAGRPPLPPGSGVAIPPPLPTDKAIPPLYLIFNKQKYTVDKDQFIIGRGMKTSDLPIRDGNISRKHAAIIRRAGSYYIKDLGSTNGIEFNGERIEARKIEEGDVYSICDYQFTFTFQ